MHIHSPARGVAVKAMQCLANTAFLVALRKEEKLDGFGNSNSLPGKWQEAGETVGVDDPLLLMSHVSGSEIEPTPAFASSLKLQVEVA